MILDLYFATPQLLWAIPFILLLGVAVIRTRAKNRLFAASRLLAFCLIIAAAANPYFIEVHTVPSPKPSITILDDRTGSMAIFDPDVAARVKSFVDAPLRTFSGDAT
ncbi:MAG: hypothetical protein WCG94_04990, partial [Methanothrix sp.]